MLALTETQTAVINQTFTFVCAIHTADPLLHQQNIIFSLCDYAKIV